MKKCMITFRSVTPAQRAESVLKRSGIQCALRRTPRWMEEQGCGYSVQLPGENVPEAVRLLTEGQIPYRKVYLLREGSRPEEMHL